MEKISGEMDIPFYGIILMKIKNWQNVITCETIPDIFFFRDDGKPLGSIIGYGNVEFTKN